ncbi:MAG TPA: hypothetical protein PKM88_02910 [bacterium]|nr:hypothetical protein [bacterium]
MTLIEELQQGGELFQKTYNALHVCWTKPNDGEIEFRISKTADGGFDVILHANDKEIIVYGLGAHQHIDAEQTPCATVDRALGLTYDLLTPNMRIAEYAVAGKPYQWKMQILINDTWKTYATTRLLTWTLFRKTSKTIFQNSQLPIREEAVELRAAALCRWRGSTQSVNR